MSWKKLRSLHMPYEKQVLIRATCLLYHEQPKEVQDKIDRLCREIGGPNEKALRECMLTKNSITQISMAHYIDETVLYALRKKFYENW